MARQVEDPQGNLASRLFEHIGMPLAIVLRSQNLQDAGL